MFEIHVTELKPTQHRIVDTLSRRPAHMSRFGCLRSCRISFAESPPAGDDDSSSASPQRGMDRRG